MLDKDKLILVFYVGLEGAGNERIYFDQITRSINSNIASKYDDSVNFIVLPDPSSDRIEIKKLNTELTTPKELERIISDAKDLIKELAQKS